MDSDKQELDSNSSHDIPSKPKAKIITSVDDFSCSVHFNGKSMHQLTAEDLIGRQFISLADAEDFYNKYSKVMGFSIRKNDVRYDDENGEINMRRWVCNRQGEQAKKYVKRKDRIREPRAVTRVNCRAAFRVRFSKKLGIWDNNQFITEHSHELAVDHEIQFLRSHRSVKDCDKALAASMRTVGVKKSQIMDFLVNQAGCYDNVGFTTKDLYNSLDAQRQSMVLKSDSESALAYLNGKVDMDPNFFCKHTIDEEDRLAYLLWADSTARLDYQYFGDVLAFESTYKTTEYGKPLVMLVGVNNHYATCFFGCALLVDETIETYTWVLETFLSAMNNRKPISVVTDGDRAMRKAIKRVIPEARHRLCVWNLQRNAQSNVRNNPNFIKVFTDCIYEYFTPKEFDKLWWKMVEAEGLQNNDWVNNIYSKRIRWAKTFLRGHFFADMRTTQRCEGMNAYMNRFLQRKLKLQEFVRQVDRALSRARYKELDQSFQTKHSSSLISTHLPSLEKHAESIYTRKLFIKVHDQIRKEAQFMVSTCVNLLEMQVYQLTRFKQAEKTWTVIYHSEDQSFQCSCMEFESSGIPCCHLFSVMKFFHLFEIPDSLFNRRWTKDIKFVECLPMSLDDQSRDVLKLIRYGSLSSEFNEICYYASRIDVGYRKLKTYITQLRPEMIELSINSEEKRDSSSTEVRNDRIIKDLLIVKTKGAPSANKNKGVTMRKCGRCKLPGHKKRKCSILNSENMSATATNRSYKEVLED